MPQIIIKTMNCHDPSSAVSTSDYWVMNASALVLLPVTAIRVNLRSMSIKRQTLTQNLTFIPKTPITLKKSGGLWRVQEETFRPLVLLFEYMNAKPKHVDKFVEFYHERNFDVLSVQLKPLQLFWPVTGSQLVARDVVEFITANNSFDPIVYHGFSVGGYLWGEVLKLCIDEHPRYETFTSRVRGQIIDSGVDVTEIPSAFPKAVFPENKLVQSFFEKFIRCQMQILYKQSTMHYKAAREAFGAGIIKGPNLFIYSNADPLSTKDINEAAVQDFTAKNLPCTIKEFTGSKHVMHYQKHKDEYLAQVSDFLNSLQLDLHSKFKTDSNHEDHIIKLHSKL